MKILRVITRLNIGGPGRQALMLHRELQERGYDCELVSGAPQAEEGAFPPPADRYTLLPSLRRETDFLADAKAIRALTGLMRVKRPDIVHTHTTTAGGLGRVAARRAKVPHSVHTFDGHVLSGYLSAPQTKLLATAERFLARRTDVLIAVSTQVRDDLLSLGIGREAQWRVIPHGLELDDLLNGPAPAAESRERLGLPQGVPLAGIVGRLAAIKDHATFIKTAARVAARHPDVEFVVAGDGALRPSVEEAARAALGNRVHFLGWATDLPTLYGALDIVVLTSRNEGTPLTLMEAGAAGLPVVATRVGGVPEVVRDGETGFVLPAGDDEALAAKVELLLASPETATAMGEAARTWIRARYTWQRLVADITDLYDELMQSRQ